MTGMTIRPFVLLVASLMIFACGEHELHFKIQFDQIAGLKAGDRLLFEGNWVGSVDEPRYTQDGNYLVDVTIKPNFKNAATRDAQFYIVDDPGAEGKKAIEIEQEKPGGVVIGDGETVTGAQKPSLFQAVLDRLQDKASRYQGQANEYLERFKDSLREASQQLEDELEKTLDELAEQFSQFSREFQSAPDNQELKSLQQSLNRLADEMSRAEKEIREKMKKEILPEIQARLDLLRKRLERYNRQDEMAPLDRQVDQLHRV